MTKPETVFVTFLGGPMDGRTQLMTKPLPAEVQLEPTGTNSRGSFFYLPNSEWREWVLREQPRPAPVTYTLEGLTCYRAVEA